MSMQAKTDKNPPRDPQRSVGPLTLRWQSAPCRHSAHVLADEVAGRTRLADGVQSL